MNRYFYVIFSFFVIVLLLYAHKVEAIMPLTGKIIVIDPGHGMEDPGTSSGIIYEKDINLKISLYLEEALNNFGAKVILTREGDYDLSSPNVRYRKKSDFDNRIKLINNSNADIYLSIHLNYLSDSKYYGAQVFYNKDNLKLATTIQNALNTSINGDREVKKIPSNTYMYNKLNVPGVLIECGFLSNKREKELLKTDEYQKMIANAITKGVLEYF